jgi:VIT1/CCC1 family predicted Fe2+/Mn2+ transporter
MSTNTIIVMGCANLIADGISMGLGDYISSKAEADATMVEYNREKWELENYPEGEYKEMVEVYEGMGLKTEDAQQLVDTMKQYPKFFLDHMFVDELGMLPPDEDAELWKEGLVTFLSFVFFGSVPLLTYLIAKAVGGDADDDVLFATACVATALTMFLLGVVKAKLTKSNPFKSGALMLLNGGLAALAAFAIGWCLEELLE